MLFALARSKSKLVIFCLSYFPWKFIYRFL